MTVEVSDKRDGDPVDQLPSIDGERYLYTSVTQVKAFDECPRAWWYEKKQGLKRRVGPAAQLGVRCHKQIEHLLKTGQDTRDRFAKLGAKLLIPYLPRAPFNGGDLLVEHNLKPRLVTAGGITFRAFSDVVVPPTRELPDEAEIIDHKFTGNIDAYAVTEAEMPQDLQGGIYARWVFAQWPEVKRVRFSLHYHQTKGADRDAIRRSAVLDLTTVNETWSKAERLIDGPMVEAARQTDPLQVAPASDVRTCTKYGPCSFANVCPHSPSRRFSAALLGEQPMSALLAKLTQKTAAAPAASAPSNPAPQTQPVAASAPAPVQPAPTPAPATALVPAPSNVFAGRSTITAGMTVEGERYLLADGSEGIQTGTSKHLVFFERAEGMTKIEQGALVSPVTPPAAPVQPAPTPPAPVQPAPTPAAAPAVLATGVLPPDAPASNPSAATVAAPQLPPPAAEATPAKSKRGRKPKTAETAASSDESGDLILFIGCRPTKSTALDLTEYVIDAAQDLAEKCGLPDVRVAGTDSPIGFGKWKGALAAHALANPPKGSCVIFPGELADPVIEALSGIAAEVIR